MKYLPILAALAILVAGTAEARDIKEMSQAIKQPIVIEGGNSRLMDVTFNHKSHKGISCIKCHHKAVDEDRYVSCRTCHKVPGARERGHKSMFVAFHSRKDNSCFGCHKQKVMENPEKHAGLFMGCNPCHVGPQDEVARKAAVEAIKAAGK